MVQRWDRGVGLGCGLLGGCIKTKRSRSESWEIPVPTSCWRKTGLPDSAAEQGRSSGCSRRPPCGAPFLPPPLLLSALPSSPQPKGIPKQARHTKPGLLKRGSSIRFPSSNLLPWAARRGALSPASGPSSCSPLSPAALYFLHTHSLETSLCTAQWPGPQNIPQPGVLDATHVNPPAHPLSLGSLPPGTGRPLGSKGKSSERPRARGSTLGHAGREGPRRGPSAGTRCGAFRPASGGAGRASPGRMRGRGGVRTAGPRAPTRRGPPGLKVSPRGAGRDGSSRSGHRIPAGCVPGGFRLLDSQPFCGAPRPPAVPVSASSRVVPTPTRSRRAAVPYPPPLL
nr:basic proline-rich protein-like [Oryctolagus cuniculus]